jgi:hypothetical protein
VATLPLLSELSCNWCVYSICILAVNSFPWNMSVISTKHLSWHSVHHKVSLIYLLTSPTALPTVYRPWPRAAQETSSKVAEKAAASITQLRSVTLKMDAAGSSETVLPIYQTIRHHNPENTKLDYLQFRCTATSTWRHDDAPTTVP